MEQHSARMSRHSEQQAVPAARRPKQVRPPRPAREGGPPRRPSTGAPAGRQAAPAARVPLWLPGADRLFALVARLPAPRLTGLGAGVLAVLAMMVIGGLDGLLLDGHAPTYGVFFVLVCAASAFWVRPADLPAPPVAAPLAFTAGLFFILRGGEGFGGAVMGLFTGLSMMAGWLYGGTLLAGLIVLVRRVLYVTRRRAERGRRGTRAERTEEDPGRPHGTGTGPGPGTGPGAG